MFRVSTQAQTWVKSLLGQDPFKLSIDIYYIFCLTGLAAEEIKEIEGASHDILDYFPTPYQDHQRLIINFLLISEKNRLGIANEDKDRIKKELIEKFIDPNINSLTSSGRSRLNDYANAGHRILSGKMATPGNAAVFLEVWLNEMKEIEKK